MFILLAQLDINEAPANTQAQIGDTVTFNCSLSWEPAPDVMWSSNSSSNITSTEVQLDPATTFSQITISNVQISDYQYYTCHGRSFRDVENLTAVLGGMWSPLEFHATYLSSYYVCKISFSAVLEAIEGMNTIAFPGQDITLNCTVMGFPAPTVEWQSTAFAGRVLPTNAIKVDAVTSVYQLTYNNISAANVGHMYTCVYANVFGEKLASPILIEEGSKLRININIFAVYVYVS